MTPEEKQSRLNELKRIVYPSDQELEEMEKLQEELSIIYKEETTTFKETNVNLGMGKGQIIQPKKKYKGIISGRIEKWRDQRREQNKQPQATIEEITQLQLELRKAELLRDINEAQQQTKSKKRNGWEIFRSVVGTNNSPINKEPQRKRSKDPVDKINKGLDRISGKHNDKDYSALTD